MTRLLPLTEMLEAHASGAAWIESQRTLLVADLHLGRGWAHRRRGELWPLTGDNSASKLDSVITELKPVRIVLLGDAVHAPKPDKAEREEIECHFHRWQSQSELLLVQGNHDRAFASDFRALKIPVADAWQGPGFTAIHGDRQIAKPEGRYVLGHLHPALSIEDAAGVKHKLPVFLIGTRTIVLPAFSPLARGSNMWRKIPPELIQLEGSTDFAAIAATGQQVAEVGLLSKHIGRTGSETNPERYQRGR